MSPLIILLVEEVDFDLEGHPHFSKQYLAVLIGYVLTLFEADESTDEFDADTLRTGLRLKPAIDLEGEGNMSEVVY